MSHRGNSGYTLLELITVIAMMSVLATLMTSVWFQIMGAWHLTKTRTSLERDMQNAFETMRKDFDMLLSPDVGGAPLKGLAYAPSQPIDQLGPVKTFNETAYDSVTFAAARPNAEGLLEPQRVTYRIRMPEPGLGLDRVLVRAISPMDAPVGAEGELQVLPAATELRIEYLDAGEWKTGWSEERLPKAVRINVTAMVPEDLRRPSTQEEAISRVVVFPIRVQ